MSNPILFFRGNYRFLSNFFPCSVLYDGYFHTSSEHAFQAAKTNIFEHKTYVRQAATPGEAKARGKIVTLRPDWEEVKIPIMTDIVRVKFKDNGLRFQLDQTGDAELVEGNTWGDTFWGVCHGMGENWLGRILMQVRAENRGG